MEAGCGLVRMFDCKKCLNSMGCHKGHNIEKTNFLVVARKTEKYLQTVTKMM